MENQSTSWQKIILKYSRSDLRRSIWQIVNSFVPYVILWYLMYRSLEWSYWITLGLSVIAAGFLIRLFIISHDCGHNSFFRSKKANTLTGIITGILSFTPFYYWTLSHAVHHSTAGNLDKRGTGDIRTLTTEEYLHLPRKERLKYRGYRNPFVLLLLGPILLIFFTNRFTTRSMSGIEKRNIYVTNFSLLSIAVILSLLIGLKSYLMIQLPIIYFAQSAGIWLFYVQHQFEGVIWTRGKQWNYFDIAFRGCSFLKLPRLFQWFTGNIGFHHIHHLGPRIPNYKLEMCHYENNIFRDVKPLHFTSTFKALTLALWDEANGKLVRFSELKMSGE